jgi:hypothetical protein
LRIGLVRDESHLIALALLTSHLKSIEKLRILGCHVRLMLLLLEVGSTDIGHSYCRRLGGGGGGGGGGRGGRWKRERESGSRGGGGRLGKRKGEVGLGRYTGENHVSRIGEDLASCL